MSEQNPSSTQYWWCLLHQQVEGDAGCGHKDRLGPYATPQAARAALQSARERSASWDDEDERWRQ